MEATAEIEKPKKNQVKEYLKGWVPYRIKRYWVYTAATVIAMVMPWITINGNHLFLLSFDQKKLLFHLSSKF